MQFLDLFHAKIPMIYWELIHFEIDFKQNFENNLQG